MGLLSLDGGLEEISTRVLARYGQAVSLARHRCGKRATGGGALGMATWGGRESPWKSKSLKMESP